MTQDPQFTAGFNAGKKEAATFVAGHAAFYRASLSPLSETSDPPLTPKAAAEVAEQNRRKIAQAEIMDTMAAAIRSLGEKPEAVTSDSPRPTKQEE